MIPYEWCRSTACSTLSPWKVLEMNQNRLCHYTWSPLHIIAVQCSTRGELTRVGDSQKILWPFSHLLIIWGLAQDISARTKQFLGISMPVLLISSEKFLQDVAGGLILARLLWLYTSSKNRKIECGKKSLLLVVGKRHGMPGRLQFVSRPIELGFPYSNEKTTVTLPLHAFWHLWRMLLVRKG